MVVTTGLRGAEIGCEECVGEADEEEVYPEVEGGLAAEGVQD